MVPEQESGRSYARLVAYREHHWPQQAAALLASLARSTAAQAGEPLEFVRTRRC